MNCQFNPFAVILLASALISGFVSYSAFKRLNQTPVASLFMVMMALITLWSLGYAIELSSTSHFNAFLGVRIYYISIVSVPVLFLIFSAQYGEIDKFLNRYTVTALFLIPSITLILNWSFEYHQLYYKATSMDYSSSKAKISFVPGPWFWVQLSYSYACMFGGTVILVKRLIQVKKIFRKQLILIIAGTALPWIGSILDIFVQPFRDISLSPLSFIFMGIIFYYALYSKRFLDIIPIARDKIIESITEGLLVLDLKERIIDSNRKLLQMSSIPDVDIIGRSVEAVFSSVQPLAVCFKVKTESSKDIPVSINDNHFTYRVRSTPLFSPGNRQVGTLFILTDMTGLYTVMKELESARDDLQMKNDLISTLNLDLEKRVHKAVVALREKEELLTLQGRYAAMGEMIDFTAHQWKQHLYAANLRIEAMKNRVRRDEAVVIDDIDSIESAVKNMNDTLREFRNFVAPASDSAKLFPVKGSVESALSLMMDILMVDGISVIKDFNESPCVTGHVNELSQVVMNIINNARVICQIRNINKPEIRISINRDVDNAEISITDNGGGIDKKDMSMIFNKFYSTTESSGLGLYMSRMIIEQHFNGTINAVSDGGETTFTISLPMTVYTE